MTVLIRRFRVFRRKAEAVAMIAEVKTMDFMGRRVADAMMTKGVTEKEKRKNVRFVKEGQRTEMCEEL